MFYIIHPVVYNIYIYILLHMSNKKKKNNIKKKNNLAIALCFVINALHYLTVHFCPCFVSHPVSYLLTSNISQIHLYGEEKRGMYVLNVLG